MPKVGNKEFPYTAKGKRRAASARRKQKTMKPKSRRGMK